MEQKNRTILVIAIAVTMLAAVFVSVVLPSLTGKIPEVVLPDANQETSLERGDFLPVEVTPETVQSVIATLSRPERYCRELTVTLSWSSGQSSGSTDDRVKIWADEGWTKTEITSGGSVQHRLVGDGKLYLWYGGDTTWKETQAAERASDLAQRIPTYEDVLDLDPETITDAGYQRRNDKDCIYVEVNDESLGSRDRYWIETATGLLCAAETQVGDRTVYEMAETSLQAGWEGSPFTLPDGTILYENLIVVQEEHSAEG